MKNNYKNIIAAALMVLSLGACKKSLELQPISNLSDDNFWKTNDQYDAFVAAIHNKFRGHNNNFS